ncbi:hypothetical protein F2Q68_00015002 [Brassica cretica]|uniref:RNase H type-1 domain-containing protein n=2 Tax=Brassica cretica TaxID=69181 RepID=A0A8S9HE58_BRACR|nr:hypothetical protein F2Q68_00015002 [Brassica cretica]KAF3606605.1 hypothetical protein DY000_02047745 [Brassica cretica]
MDPNLSLANKLALWLDLMLVQSIPIDSRRAIPWLLWAVWKNMNAVIFASTQESLGSCPSALVRARRWSPPLKSQVKCNIHANWRNDKLHCGGSWITRDHQGRVGRHAREAFTSSPDKLTAELRVLIWILQSMQDLQVQEVVIGSDHCDLVEAIKRPNDWPRYRWLLHQVTALTREFPLVCFEIESSASNHVAREIAKSVMRNSMFQSYLALGGPSWLHDRIRQESAF